MCFILFEYGVKLLRLKSAHLVQAAPLHTARQGHARVLEFVCIHRPLGSGPRYMICVTLFCTLRESGYRQNSHLLTVVSLVMLVNIWKCVQFHHLLAHGMNNRGLVIQGSIGCPAHLQEWRRKQDE